MKNTDTASLLFPTETKLCETVKRMNGVTTVRSFVQEMIYLGTTVSDKARCVWVTNNAFISIDQHWKHEKFIFHFLNRRHPWENATLFIYAPTHADAKPCVDFLVGLDDSFFDELHVRQVNDGMSNTVVNTANHHHRQCILTCCQLRKLVANGHRSHRFTDLYFSYAQCEALVSNPKGVKLELESCVLEDKGAALVQITSQPRCDCGRHHEIHFSGFYFSRPLPFSREHWLSFLHRHKGVLKLTTKTLDHEESQAIGKATVQELVLTDCRFADCGANLIDAIGKGSGPRAICISTNLRDRSFPFESPTQCIHFADSLKNKNCQLTRLYVNNVTFRHISPHADHDVLTNLAEALRENRSIVQLTLRNIIPDTVVFSQLTAALAYHPGIQELHLAVQSYCPSIPVHESIEQDKMMRTKFILDLLTINPNIEIVIFDRETYHLDYWETYVAPRLEHNIYRKRFRALQNSIALERGREALIPQIWKRIQHNPSLVYTLLMENYLDCFSTP